MTISRCSFVDLASAYPEVRRRLESWPGYEVLDRALNRFADLQVFLAGGVIRNTILDAAPPAKDFDFFLGGPSIAPALALFRAHGVLEETPFGSPRWHPAGDPERYADLIPIADFIPGLWRCEDIVDVLNQFDYTASALAFDLRSGAAFDPQNGFRDLTRGIMRMVRFDYPEGPFKPGARLSRNAILWFRVLHYAHLLGFTIEPITLAWLKAHRGYDAQREAFAALFFPPHDGYLEPL